MSWLNKKSRLNAAIAAWRQKIEAERAAAELKAEQELEAQRIAEIAARNAATAAAQAAAELKAEQEAAAALATAQAAAAAAQAAAEAEAIAQANAAKQYADVLVANITGLPSAGAEAAGTYLMSDGNGGSFWSYMGQTADVSKVDNTQWLYRSIYTHGFLAAGYKGSNPWRSVNKTWHATEVTMYCGEQLAYTQGYTNGVWSDYHSYVVAGAGFNVATSIICSHNLLNGTIRTFSPDGFSSTGVSYGYSGNNPKAEAGIEYGTAGYGGDVGGMAMSEAKIDPPATQSIKDQNGYIAGGGTASNQKLHFPTEVMYTTTTNSNTGRGDASYGETKGWFRFNGTTYANMAFATDTWAAGGWSCAGGDYHSKMMGTKHGHFYADDGANVTLPKRKINQSTGASLSVFNKVRAYGEGNEEDGQDNGYIMGHYDGQQNNHTIRQSYTSDTEVTLGAAAQPKGHYGQSSGACSTAAATVAAMSGV